MSLSTVPARAAYLDNAATSFPKPEQVYRAAERCMRECGASPGRGLYPRALEAEETVLETRRALAEFLGVADASRIAFAFNATDAINLALKGFVRPGDRVVTTILEHNAVLRPLRWLEKNRGVHVEYVQADEWGELDLEGLRRALLVPTRLVVAVHGNNVLGTILPVQQVIQIAHDAGVPVLLDGSQTAGALPVDLNALGVDLFAFTGHKALMGLTGTGGLYIGPGLSLDTLREGGTGTSSESPEPPELMPERFEPGTPNTLGLAALGEGVRWHLERGVTAAREHEAALSQELLEELADMKGLKVYSPRHAAKRLGIVTVNFEDLAPTEACAMLGRKLGVMVRCGLHCAPLTHRRLGTEKAGALRFSVGALTTEEDIELAVAAVEQMLGALYRNRRS